jgi:hypothetical protein
VILRRRDDLARVMRELGGTLFATEHPMDKWFQGLNDAQKEKPHLVSSQESSALLPGAIHDHGREPEANAEANRASEIPRDGARAFEGATEADIDEMIACDVRPADEQDARRNSRSHPHRARARKRCAATREHPPSVPRTMSDEKESVEFRLVHADARYEYWQIGAWWQRVDKQTKERMWAHRSEIEPLRAHDLKAS